MITIHYLLEVNLTKDANNNDNESTNVSESSYSNISSLTPSQIHQQASITEFLSPTTQAFVQRPRFARQAFPATPSPLVEPSIKDSSQTIESIKLLHTLLGNPNANHRNRIFSALAEKSGSPTSPREICQKEKLKKRKK